MRYVFPIAIACALAFGPNVYGQVVEDGADPNQVVEQQVYDLGVVKAEDPDAVVETAPEGKADTLVVVTATWCRPCQLIKPTLIALKAQGYNIKIYDIDLDTLPPEYSNIKRVKSKSDKVNEWNVVPTLFFIRGDDIIKKHEGYISRSKIRTTLWKPESEKGPVVENVNKVRALLPWNK